MDTDFVLRVPDVSETSADDLRGANATSTTVTSANPREVEIILSVDLTDPDSRMRARRIVETLGADPSTVAKSQLLDKRMRAFAEADSGNDRIGDDLRRLAASVKRLDAPQQGRRAGLLGRLFDGPRPASTPEEARAEASAIVASLEGAVGVLRQNEVALDGFEGDLRTEAQWLTAALDQANAIWSALTAAIGRARVQGEALERIRFYESDVLFSLEQRRGYLETLRAVNQQAQLSIAMLRDTNQVLIQSIRRITQGTVRALGLALEVRGSMAQRRRVYEAARSAVEPVIAAAGEAPAGSVDLTALQASFDELLDVLEKNDAWRRSLISSAETALAELKNMTDAAAGSLGS